MKLLLDTHAFLWWLDDSPRLGRKARAAIEDAENFVFVSAASAWEIAVKRSDDKLRAPGDVSHWITANGFAELAIEIRHAVASAELPKHHTGPFYRLLIAQAQLEEMRLIASDPEIDRYEVDILPADE